MGDRYPHLIQVLNGKKSFYLIGMDKIIFPWMFDSKILSNNAFRLYLLLYCLSELPVNKGKSLPLNRAAFARRLGYSVNSLKSALTELLDFKMVEISPNDKSKLNLNSPKFFNRDKIIFLSIKQVDSSNSDGDGDNDFSEYSE